MLTDMTKKLLDGNHLSAEEASMAIDSIVSDGQSPVAVAAFLTALRMKGETADELIGAARVMRQRVMRVPHRQTMLLDTCGTGGDRANTFNISTTAAFVVAAGGVPVGKHGNRAVSSRSGSADLLEALGANIMLTEHTVGMCIDTIGLGFMFAPNLHPAMKAVAPIRKELGFRTIFNLLGPLANPAGATHQIIGVFDERYLLPVAATAHALGIEGVMVVHNMTGIDELAPIGENRIAVFRHGRPEILAITASDCGIQECSLDELAGGNSVDNARITRAILAGETGARRDTVAMNAGLAFVVAGRSLSLKEGVEQAQFLITSGKAAAKLEEFVEYTRGFDHA